MHTLPSRLFAALFALLLASPAVAGDAMRINVGQATIVHLSRPAKSVVLGDPAVADISIEGADTLAVFGRRAGGTSLVVLDETGKTLVSATVIVGMGGPGGVAVTAATGKDADRSGGHTVTWVCAGGACTRQMDPTK